MRRRPQEQQRTRGSQYRRSVVSEAAHRTIVSRTFTSFRFPSSITFRLSFFCIGRSEPYTRFISTVVVFKYSIRMGEEQISLLKISGLNSTSFFGTSQSQSCSFYCSGIFYVSGNTKNTELFLICILY